MSRASGAYPQKIKRKRSSTESGVMDRDLSTGSLGPTAQEAGRGDDIFGVYGGDIYDDSSEEEEEERPVKKRKGLPLGSACREQGCDKWAKSGGLCVKHGGGTRKPCLVEGCGTLAQSRGLCVKHGGGIARKPCSVEGCGTLAQSRGLCGKHGGSSMKPCLVEGCGTLAQTRGLCRKHGGGTRR